jgi:preprotein translocase subunit YajC
MAPCRLADLNQGATISFPVEGYVVTKQWAQQNPHTLAAFYQALKQGQQIAVFSGPVGTVDKISLQRVVNVMQQFLNFPTDFNINSMLLNGG